MRLDRNINGRTNKYALIKVRRLEHIRKTWDGSDGDIADLEALEHALKLLERAGILDWGNTVETEFFVIRLRDRFAAAPLHEYAHCARLAGHFDYASDVEALSRVAGVNRLDSKIPD